MGEQLLDPADVAERLNVSKAKAYTILKSGEIPIIRIGTTIRIRPEDLEKYINEKFGPGSNGEQGNVPGAGQ